LKQFRDYQTSASDAIVSTWDKHRSGMCVVATGGGKTVIAAGTTKRIQGRGRVLYLANRNELCTQPLGAFRDQLGFVTALEKAEVKASLDAPVVIGSVQTLTRTSRLERFPRDHFSFIFADEAHGCASDSWKRIFEHFNQAKICGITATPFRSDAKSLKDIFETESYRKDLFSLVDDGWLVSPDHVDKLSSAISLANVRVKRNADGQKDYDLQESADAIQPYFEAIAREIAEKHASKFILAFLPLVASSEKFVAACKSQGINAVHIDCQDPFRQEKLQGFKDGQIQLLSNSNLLHTGIDIPKCNCTLNLRPTKSKVLYCQFIDRSSRTVPEMVENIQAVTGRLAELISSEKTRDKTLAYILDPMWLTSDFDLCTPSFLIADNQEIAGEIHKAGGSSYSLRSVARAIQIEKEAAIQKRLQTVASFREGSLDADFFAASIQDHQLVNYEAVYRWEEAPPNNFDKLLLAKAGINPETARNKGHAKQLMLAIGKRRHKGLAEIRSLADVADARGVNNPEIWQVTKRDLRGHVFHAQPLA
jgi:superfamily II DNA or RNA helicase